MDDIWADTTGQKYLYRYRPPSIYAINDILLGQLFFQVREKLNDPGEEIILFSEAKRLTDDEIIRLYLKCYPLDAGMMQKRFVQDPNGARKSIIEWFEETEKDFKKWADKSKNYGLCCFSKKSMNPTMFAHYSSNSGVVFAYDREVMKKSLGLKDRDFLDVLYINHPSKLDLIEYLSVDRKILQDDADVIKGAFLRTKYRDWSYEDEVRIIKKQLGSSYQACFDSLVAVCLAPKADDATKDVFEAICKLRNIPLYQATVTDSYEYFPRRISK